jgi:hypothetical protein
VHINGDLQISAVALVIDVHNMWGGGFHGKAPTRGRKMNPGSGGHPVTGGHKYGDLDLQFGEVSA